MQRLTPSLLSLLFVFFFSHVQFTNSFPAGAPPQSCVENVLDAIPPYAHLKSTKVFNVTTLPQPANATGGFTYTFSSNTYTAGVPVTLTINDTLGTVGFRGYFYQAFDQYMNRVGTWTSSYYYNNSLTQGQILVCPNGGTAVTHTATLGNSKKGIRPHILTLTLTIPTTGMGPISVSGITLTDRAVWYLVNISTILTEAVPPSAVPSTRPPSTPSVPYYSPIPMSVVQQHNTSTDCWTVYDNNVYDQTYWAMYHPSYSTSFGSPTPVDYTQMFCGGDGSIAYKLQTVHNITRRSLYLAYMGPLLIPTTQPPTTSPPGSTTQPPTTASGPVQVSVSPDTLKAANSESNCLTAINGNVYDATKYLPKHPNGKALIVTSCGTDASYSYNNVMQHIPANLPVSLVLKGPLQGYQFTTGISVSEVQNHNSSSSCWMILYNQVYDFTAFIPIHEGGSAPLLVYCGMEATQVFLASSPDHEPTEIAENVVWLGPTTTIVSPTNSGNGGSSSTGSNGGTTAPPSNTGDASVSISMSVSLSASLASEPVANISATILNALATGLLIPPSRIRIDAVTIQLSSNSFKRILRSLAATTGSMATVVFTILPATTASPAPASTLASLVFYTAQTTSTTLGGAFQAAGVAVMSAPVLATPAPTAAPVSGSSSGSDSDNATMAIIIGVCVGGGVLLLIAILSFCMHARNHQLKRASSISGKGPASETRGLQMSPAVL